MAEPAQNYKNHVRLLPPFHFFVLPVLFLNVIVSLWSLRQNPGLPTVWGIIVAAALAMLALLARVQTLTVQDRVIRLEMRLRLHQVLPADLQPRIRGLTHRQLVALRFASDEELPELVREIAEGRLTTSKEIKLRVKTWQPDWLRA